MLFTSPEFLILLLATLALYYATGSRRAQIAVLTAASFVFYAWESPGLVFLLLMSIAINVVTSHRIACGAPELRKAWAVAGVVSSASS
jgi:alginate O-acetyltransferase complex protein AlgI